MATANELRAAIRECLDGHLCVQAWVGYGSALFIGFGTYIIPASEQEDGHPMPPYELQTSFADWQVKSSSEVLETSDDEHEGMVSAVEALVGCAVLSWEYNNEAQEISIAFDNDLSLNVKPYPSDEFPDADSWWFVLTEANRVMGVTSDLTISEGVYSSQHS